MNITLTEHQLTKLVCLGSYSEDPISCLSTLRLAYFELTSLQRGRTVYGARAGSGGIQIRPPAAFCVASGWAKPPAVNGV